jgi:uncharacterized protein YndB with AHSA1/START domain
MKTAIKTMDLELSRTIPASPAEAFDAWLDPACPGSPWHGAAKIVIDLKVDGLFYWSIINKAGEAKPHYGRFTVIERPRMVQHTWMGLHTHGLETLVIVSYQKKGADTLMTLRHEGLPDDEHGQGHEKGWTSLMSQFAERIQRQRQQG